MGGMKGYNNARDKHKCPPTSRAKSCYNIYKNIIKNLLIGIKYKNNLTMVGQLRGPQFDEYCPTIGKSSNYIYTTLDIINTGGTRSVECPTGCYV
jgi:hypothetical protein